MAKKNQSKKFNYTIGHYWSEGESGRVGCYSYGSVYFYGTMEEAKKLLKFVKNKYPEKDWRIFQLVEVPA